MPLVGILGTGRLAKVALLRALLVTVLLKVRSLLIKVTELELVPGSSLFVAVVLTVVVGVVVFRSEKPRLRPVFGTGVVGRLAPVLVLRLRLALDLALDLVVGDCP